jgi:hypothetical protein
MSIYSFANYEGFLDYFDGKHANPYSASAAAASYADWEYGHDMMAQHEFEVLRDVAGVKRFLANMANESPETATRAAGVLSRLNKS